MWFGKLSKCYLLMDIHREDNCIFCKIVHNEAPSVRVYEDEHVVAFMDIAPITLGHTLVIPKKHYATLDAMSAEDMAKIGSVLPRIAKAVILGCGTKDFNIMQNNGKRAGQVVFHVHYHIIPRHPTEGKLFGKPNVIPKLKLTKEEMESLQSSIKSHL
ncbi:HIT-like domain-containing protein [Umbelopsis sp. PMI_123]|nr:HIT-like domain-containing protein [Umbelopsis sp. PMI_123]